MTRNTVRVLFAAICFLLLPSSCQHIDYSSDWKSGQFVDGPVEGLRYAIDGVSDFTDAEGRFGYRTGDIVSFYVGDILIGSAPGAERITPFDLAGIPAPESDEEIRSAIAIARSSSSATALEKVINIAVFLQTVDQDGDTSNGIQIPRELHALALGSNLDLTRKWQLFRDDFAYGGFLAAARASGIWSGQRNLRSAGDAMDALYVGIQRATRIEGIAYVDEDFNGDNQADSRATHIRDASGETTTIEYENLTDGSISLRFRSEKGAEQNQTISTVEYPRVGHRTQSFIRTRTPISIGRARSMTVTPTA